MRRPSPLAPMVAAPLALLLLGSSAAAALAPLGERTFCRAKDYLSMGERATAREVVNVLGRWSSQAQWNEIGVARDLDRYDPTDGYLEFRRSGVRVSPDRTPMRRAACKKRNQAQRFLLKENVGSLPFRNAKMAASVGASVAELNREPVSELACDIVFDVRTLRAGLNADPALYAHEPSRARARSPAHPPLTHRPPWARACRRYAARNQASWEWASPTRPALHMRIPTARLPRKSSRLTWPPAGGLSSPDTPYSQARLTRSRCTSSFGALEARRPQGPWPLPPDTPWSPLPTYDRCYHHRLDAFSMIMDYQQTTMSALQQGWADEGLAVLPLPLALIAVRPPRLPCPRARRPVVWWLAAGWKRLWTWAAAGVA